MTRHSLIFVLGTSLLSGCYQSHAGSAPDDGGPLRPDTSITRRDGGPPVPPTRAVDLLFLVDSSNSMAEEQASLAAGLPQLVVILTTGDFNQDGDTSDPTDFAPFTDLHVGVVTTDMGTGGFMVPTCARAESGDDGLLRTTGNESDASCEPTYPTFLAYQGSAELLAHDATCVARVGTRGCGFEQPLESVLKALSPSSPQPWTAPGYDPPIFFGNTLGHGDRANAGFAREGSVLAIVLVTDEEDCSVSDPELFNPSSTIYTGDLNLRCFNFASRALAPLERYLQGFLQLRVVPRRLAVVPVVGIPVDLVPATGATPDYSAILDDPRMQEVIDPEMPFRLRPSCNVPGRGLAFPPRRMLQLARELDVGGAEVSLSSICQQEYPVAPLVDALVRAGR